MKKKLARILALTLAAMMVLTACGDGGKKDDGGKTDTPPASTDGETPSTPDETPDEGETPAAARTAVSSSPSRTLSPMVPLAATCPPSWSSAVRTPTSSIP